MKGKERRENNARITRLWRGEGDPALPCLKTLPDDLLLDNFHWSKVSDKEYDLFRAELVRRLNPNPSPSESRFNEIDKKLERILGPIPEHNHDGLPRHITRTGEGVWDKECPECLAALNREAQSPMKPNESEDARAPRLKDRIAELLRLASSNEDGPSEDQVFGAVRALLNAVEPNPSPRTCNPVTPHCPKCGKNNFHIAAQRVRCFGCLTDFDIEGVAVAIKPRDMTLVEQLNK